MNAFDFKSLVSQEDLNLIATLHHAKVLRAPRYVNGGTNTTATMDATKAQSLTALGLIAFTDLVVGKAQQRGQTTTTKNGATIATGEINVKFPVTITINGETIRFNAPHNTLQAMCETGTVEILHSTTLNPEHAAKGLATVWLAHPNQDRFVDAPQEAATV